MKTNCILCDGILIGSAVDGKLLSCVHCNYCCNDSVEIFNFGQNQTLMLYKDHLIFGNFIDLISGKGTHININRQDLKIDCETDLDKLIKNLLLLA
jgi:hypothetical protein